MTRASIALLSVPILLSPPAVAGVLHVPADHPTIQAGIDAAADGDTVLVAPGVYRENVDFGGKNIHLASHYVLDGNPRHIRGTVIDGGSPSDPDVASCVLFVSGEDRAAVLEGFTLTGGRGTRWLDFHLNQYYREGGGVLVELSSPTIRHNLIVGNEAVDASNVVSAGGGGIRIGDGNPLVQGNVIMNNRGRYGAGVVLNFAQGEILNNVIARNYGGEAFGGGGIWTYAGGNSRIDNNTIVGNRSATRGGGILVWSTTVSGRHNVLWGNSALIQGPQVHVFAGSGAALSYCDVQGGWPGTQNLDANPRFLGAAYLLGTGSPCIDAGDPDPQYEDPEDPDAPGAAAFPAMGLLRADIGAHGGPGSAEWFPRLLGH